MKRIVVFLLSFLLLVFVSISVSGNNAFAKSEKCNTPPTYSLRGGELNMLAFHYKFCPVCRCCVQ
jgi:hypothetical protein